MDRVLELVMARLTEACAAIGDDAEHPSASSLARSMEHALAAGAKGCASRLEGPTTHLASDSEYGAIFTALLRAREKAGPVTTEAEEIAWHAAIEKRWDSTQSARVVAFESARLAGALEDLSEEMERRRQAAERIVRVLGVPLATLSLGHDLSSGLWDKGVWDGIESLAATLADDPGLQELARILGRLDAADQALALEEVEELVARRRAVRLRGGRSEIRGVHFSNDLSLLTAADLALLASPETELLFGLKLVRRQLLTYEVDARAWLEEEVPVRRIRPRQKDRSERGPIILCIDTSGSMNGQPERVAKAAALAVVRVAARESRPCWLISFSGPSDVSEQDLADLPASLPRLIEFLAYRFGGGTDPVPALRRAVDRMEEARFERADVLLVSDGEYPTEASFSNRLAALKERMDFRVHGLLIGPGEKLGYADVHWKWGPGDEPSGLARLIRGMRWVAEDPSIAGNGDEV